MSASLTETKYGPAKSLMTPLNVQMPICPMIGHSHLKVYGTIIIILIKLLGAIKGYITLKAELVSKQYNVDNDFLRRYCNCITDSWIHVCVH